MKEEIRVAAIAAALLAAGFLSWMVNELTDCRGTRRDVSGAVLLLKSGCRKTGFHTGQIAGRSGMIPSRTAYQQKTFSP
ncbi:MAG: hypothetical protein H0U98_09685 [Alphaproteobacteria bacterium]|nr:hypothetical protein [Alphaproteobacteria bacterium]